VAMVATVRATVTTHVTQRNECEPWLPTDSPTPRRRGGREAHAAGFTRSEAWQDQRRHVNWSL